MELDHQQTLISLKIPLSALCYLDKIISKEELTEIQNFKVFLWQNLALYHLSFKARTEKKCESIWTSMILKIHVSQGHYSKRR